MRKLEIIIEKCDGLFWGRTTEEGWMPTPYGATINDVIDNLKLLVVDYVSHEGENDTKWNNIDWNTIHIDIKYDLVSFFEKFNYLRLQLISKKIGISYSLLNKYKTGIKHASLKQTKKIENAIHSMADEFYNVKLVA